MQLLVGYILNGKTQMGENRQAGRPIESTVLLSMTVNITVQETSDLNFVFTHIEHVFPSHLPLSHSL